MHPQQVTSTVNLLSAMGTTQIVLLIVLIALIALSAFFSATETAYSSCNKIRLKSLESGGSKRAARALKQLDHYDRVISTVLVGNNIVNITMTSIATVFFIELLRNTTAEQVAVTVSTIHDRACAHIRRDNSEDARKGARRRLGMCGRARHECDNGRTVSDKLAFLDVEKAHE